MGTYLFRKEQLFFVWRWAPRPPAASCSKEGSRVRETFELNQLKSTPSQLLPVSSGFDRLQTCCHEFGLANI
jgi:hypothetical protein